MKSSTRSSNVRVSWPENRLQSRRVTDIELVLQNQQPLSSRLRRLKCQGWVLKKDEAFDFYTFELSPRVRDATIEKWRDVIGCIGHEHDVLVKGHGLNVLLYRPVLTSFFNNSICLHCLPYPESP